MCLFVFYSVMFLLLLLLCWSLYVSVCFLQCYVLHCCAGHSPLNNCIGNYTYLHTDKNANYINWFELNVGNNSKMEPTKNNEHRKFFLKYI